MIKGEYLFSRQDYWALMLTIFQSPIRARLVILLIAMIYVAFVSILPLTYNGNGMLDSAAIFAKSLVTGREHYSTYLTIIFAGLIVWYFNYVATVLRYAVYAKSAAASIGTVTFCLRDDGLEISDNKAQSNIRWSTYRKVIITRDYLFLVIRFPLATMIPRRAFQSQEGFDAAIAFIKSHINKDTRFETR